MRVLTVYAHPNPRSFTHAVLEEFTRGLRDGGHEPDVLDLYAMKFDPVFRSADMAAWLHPDIPTDILNGMNPRQQVLAATSGPLQRFLARRAMSGRDNRSIARMVREHGPKDAARHWRHVAEADAMAFIAPVFWMGFPAILKGWIERVFSYGNAFALDRNGWEGNASGRIALLRHEKALVITPTMFSQADYEDGWREAMTRIVDQWTFRYPGVRRVEHIFFYGAPVVDDETIQEYLRCGYRLGRDFAAPAATTGDEASGEENGRTDRLTR